MKLALKLMPAALAVAGAFATQAQAQEASPAAASTAQEASDAKERMETVTVSARAAKSGCRTCRWPSRRFPPRPWNGRISRTWPTCRSACRT